MDFFKVRTVLEGLDDERFFLLAKEITPLGCSDYSHIIQFLREHNKGHLQPPKKVLERMIADEAARRGLKIEKQ